MTNMIDKYFREDLTEAEEKILGEELLRSEESANRFAALAEQKYHSYGLPEPVWQGGGQAGGSFLRTWGKLILLLLGGLAVFGVTGWAMLRCVRQQASAEVPTVTAPLMETNAPIEKPRVSKPAASIAAQKIVAQVVGAPPTPVVADSSPTQGKGLQIVFHMITEGRAAIRVLNPTGVEVRRLFDGNMKTGSWSVDWDGRLTDGRPATPGLYHVEVMTNGITKVREVRIR
jgi:hypothetical protein